ncbi:MAG TPA: zinc metallopeptidase [Gammaproteobacteria bacterium]|nr:zinc metallopeptidase [Gammaproteobacteria bacterium]
MPFVIFGILVLVLAVLPGVWVQSVMRRYRQPANRYPRTGGQTARQLLDAIGLRNVATEITEHGDHYDPMAKVVRLSKENFNGRSLTAVTVAAHEVGHALQDARGFGPLHWRTRLVHWVQPIEKVGAGMLLLTPLAGVLMRSPYLGLIGLAGGILTLGAGVAVHFLTLPTELDASFARALPLLKNQGVLRREDLPRARLLLTAAAFTYVAVALQSLLNIARWWAILRR